MINSESRASAEEYGPGMSLLSGIMPSYCDEMNLRVRLTKFPKLDEILVL